MIERTLYSFTTDVRLGDRLPWEPLRHVPIDFEIIPLTYGMFTAMINDNQFIRKVKDQVPLLYRPL